MRSNAIVLAVGMLLLSSCLALAEEKDAWEPVSAGPATTWTASLAQKGKLAVQPFAYYNRTRGSFDAGGHYAALPKGDKKTQFQQFIFTQYGITDKWEVSAQTVMQENYLTQSGVKVHSQGAGDSYLFTRYELMEDQPWLPEATGLLQLKVPTGRYQHEDPDKLGADLMGTGSWDPGVGINLSKALKPFMLHGDVIAAFPQKAQVNGVKTRNATSFNFDAAVEYFLPKGWSLLAEVNGFVQGEQASGGEKVGDTDNTSLALTPGIGWSNKRIQTLIAYSRTLIGTNTDANDTVIATFVWTF